MIVSFRVMQMNTIEKYNDLTNILTALRQKETQARLRGEKTAATALAQTAQKLERYIDNMQKRRSKML